jgi:hypothetical protein
MEMRVHDGSSIASGESDDAESSASLNPLPCFDAESPIQVRIARCETVTRPFNYDCESIVRITPRETNDPSVCGDDRNPVVARAAHAEVDRMTIVRPSGVIVDVISLLIKESTIPASNQRPAR